MTITGENKRYKAWKDQAEEVAKGYGLRTEQLMNILCNDRAFFSLIRWTEVWDFVERYREEDKVTEHCRVCKEPTQGYSDTMCRECFVTGKGMKVKGTN